MSIPLSMSIFLVAVLAAIFYLPGRALLTLNPASAAWPKLQQIFIALGLSIIFYPVLFYMVRFVAPQAGLRPWGMSLLLLFCAGVAVWDGRRQDAPPRPPFERLEWVALFILLLTFASRFWFVAQYPFPAWSDSLHHTLLTQLVAEHGRLPTTLEPYFPNVLDMYHLGLYALSGTAALLSGAPAHTALLWTAQTLNALCGIALYVALDRYAGRTGAIIGLAVAGLISAHPALWVNWGRFTQLSSQVVLFFAWLFTIEAVLTATKVDQTTRRQTAVLILFAALTTAGLFLLHFRVAIFYTFLLLPTLVYLLIWRGENGRVRRQMLWRMGGIGLSSLLIILPVLVAAVNVYLSTRAGPAQPPTPEQAAQMVQNYYAFPLSTIPYLAAPVWLLMLTGTAVVFGLIWRNWLILLTLVWVVALIALGNAYLLGIPLLNVTNFGAILIMAYLPISLILGAGVEALCARLPEQWGKYVTLGVLGLVLSASLPAVSIRATAVEEYRHFVTPADIEAMTWIAENVPTEAQFAINVYVWLPRFAHGTDAGYWLPYFTGHRIVTSSMLTHGLPSEYALDVWARSQAAEALKHDLTALDDLTNLGITHIYIGARGNFADAGLQRDLLLSSPRVQLLYEEGGAAVFRIVE